MSSRIRKRISSPALAGAVCTLLVWAFCAPAAARAGCSHLVTSRNDHPLFPSVLRDAIAEQGGSPAAPLVPDSFPQSPRPCRGALCSGSPAVPAVPAGAIRIVGELWAWCAAMPGLASPGLTFFATAPSDLRPIGRSMAIFHPPRHFLSPA